MSSSLKQDLIGFEFPKDTKLNEASSVLPFQELGKKSQFINNSKGHLVEPLSCEICERQFWNKKELSAHIVAHLGKPRVVLKRIRDIKPKKELGDSCWLGSDYKSDTLKFTLKKQSSCDSLKLTLKKSPISEDFTVVSNNLNFDKQSGLREKKELAGAGENDHTDTEKVEKSIDQPFENVMINQEENYEDEKYESEENNPLDVLDRPSMETNEGDSGVGSDSVNPLERDEQNVDDAQNENCISDQVVSEEADDPDGSDALEITCRQTIENLRKLGEQSRCSSSRSTGLLQGDNEIPDPPEGNNTENSNMIEELRGNSQISIVPKSAMVDRPSRSSMESESTSPDQSTTSFPWNQLAHDGDKNGEADEQNDKISEVGTLDANSDNAGSLLQNFLIEHQRRNQNENNIANNLPSFETEYVSLERLAETVSTCKVCNEKFKDIAQLDAHRSKAGHFQCNIPDCSNLFFNTTMEVSMHKHQAHGAPLSPRMNQMSPHLNQTHSPHPQSPHLNQTSPHLTSRASPHLTSGTSPHLNSTSPHSPSIQHTRNSPMASPHHTNSPTFSGPQVHAPVNFDQLPAPVQQLAQQVQRMPLPQQMPPSLPPGTNPMLPGHTYYPQPPGRPPMYRVQAPIHYPPHISHIYSQYAGNPYQHQLGVPPQMQSPMQPQMQPQIPQQMRGRYPAVMPNTRAPRLPQPSGPIPRARMKRPPMNPQGVQMQSSPVPQIKQRRMDVLLPDRNEDADCHVIAQQKRNDGVPVIQNVQGSQMQQQGNKSDSMIHLTDSITLSVRQPGPAPAQVNATVQSAKKPDASSVANVLASRGITVTPAANKANKGNEQTKQAQSQSQQKQQSPLNVSTLNLNSAISIIPAANAQRKQQEQQQQGQFAVPQNKQNKHQTSEMERPPRPPTVDLTQDVPSAPPIVRRGRPPRMLMSLTCQVCDKRFQNQEMLTQHMTTHRATSKLLHKCNLCPAQYPTPTALATHKKTYHKEVDTTVQNGNIELALPVVDLKSPQVLARLSNLGIQSYIPLSQLSAQTGGYFGLPIVTIDGARNPNTCNLGALGATSILSLGPLKHLSNG